MKYLRKHNVNPFNSMDDTILQKADGNIELNPSQRVRINGDLEFGPGASIPGPKVTNILYVTQDGNDANTGQGEGSKQAKRTLKAALAVAQQGTTIYVRSGEYVENNPLVVPPRVSIIGDSLRTTILRPLNGTLTFNITNVQRTSKIVTINTLTSHGFDPGDRVRVKAEIGTPVLAGFFVIGQRYTITTPGNTVWTSIGSPSSVAGTTFFATGAGAGTGQAALAEVDETDVNVLEVPSDTSFTYRQEGSNITSTPSTGTVKKGTDFLLVNSGCYVAQLVWKGLQAPAYCVNIDSDAIVDTSPYIQNCSNINGPWLKNGTEWLPFQTEQPDLNGTMVTGPRPLRDDEIDPLQVAQYAVDVEGAGGGMLIDGDRYNTESPILSMVAEAFTQVAQGGVGFHITNFGYMQLVSCFAVFCSKGFYTTRGGYLSISNSVIDFGDKGFLADGFYPDPYATGLITSNYYSNVGSVTVNTQGSGYSSAPTIIIDPPTSPGGVQATAVASIDPILGVINAITVVNAGSGYDFQPNITISPALGGATATANLAKNLTIDVNELSSKPQVGSVMFLGNDPVGYYVSSTSNVNLTFTYNEQKCRRDVGIILNAVLTDAIFNSNHQSTYAGVSYLRSYSSTVTSLQKAQTIAGLQEAKTQALALTANVTMQNRINLHFTTVINIINLGISVVPGISIPPTTVREPGFAESAAILIANKVFMQDELEAWIAENYPALIYDVATCRRDIAYIIDALAYDLTYEGNTQTVNSALAYAAGNVIAGQVEETQAAYEYWKTIVGRIVKNQAIIPTVGNTTTQNISLPLGSPLDPNGPAVAAQNLLQIVINVVDHGTGYIPDPVTEPTYSYANDPILLAERETILDSSVAIQEAVIDYLNSVYGGQVTVATFPPIQSVSTGTEANFHNVSTISTSSTAMEYVGAGITYNALPFFGGEPIPANERVEYNNGKCFTVTSDQVGNYRIGQFFNVNALTGEVTINAENINLQGIAAIGPFKRNGIPVGVQLKEVSNNSNLIASTGFADVNTVPTQPAVQTYVENRYLNKVTTNATSVASTQVTFAGDIAVNNGDIYSTATTFNLLNKDSVASISDDGPTTINAFLNAGTINIAHTTSTTNINGNLEVKGSIVSTTQTNVSLINTAATTVNAFGAATSLNVGAGSGTTTVGNNLQVNLNTTLGVNTNSSNVYWGVFTANIRDNTSNVFEIKESSNSYIKIDTANSSELTTFGSLAQVLFSNTTDAFSSTIAAAAFAGGVGIAKKLFVGTDLSVSGNTELGNLATNDTLTVTAKSTINVPNNNATALLIQEAANGYITVVTTNTDESVTIGTTPKLKVLNTTDSTTKDTGAVIVEGGVGIEKNLTVGVDLNVDQNATITGDLAVNGGDITTNQATFNLLNTNATTVNAFGAAEVITIGGAPYGFTGTLIYLGAAGTSGNTVFVRSTSDGIVILSSNVTNGGIVMFTGNEGVTSLAKSGIINLGNTGASATTTVNIGGNVSGNQLKILGTADGLVTVTSDVTTGTVDLFNTVTTGTINIGTGGASVVNIGGTGGTLNAQTLTLAVDLEVQYGGTGQSSFTPNGVIYGNNTSGLLVTAASNPGSNATTSYGILTTDGSNVPTWTDVIDGGNY